MDYIENALAKKILRVSSRSGSGGKIQGSSAEDFGKHGHRY